MKTAGDYRDINDIPCNSCKNKQKDGSCLICRSKEKLSGTGCIMYVDRK